MLQHLNGLKVKRQRTVGNKKRPTERFSLCPRSPSLYTNASGSFQAAGLGKTTWK